MSNPWSELTNTKDFRAVLNRTVNTMFRFLLFGVLLDIFLVYAFSKNFKMKNEATIDIARALNAILSENISPEKKDLHLSLWFDEKKIENLNFFNDISDAVLSNFKKGLNIVGYQNSVIFQSTVHYQLILVDTFDAMRNIYSKQQRTGSLPYTIIYISKINSKDDKDITTALELCWNLHILNVGIIISETRNSNSEIVMLTYYPYTPVSCEVIKPVLLNRFDKLRGLWLSRNFFPEKIRNFYGCPLTAATWEDMPYLEVQRNSVGKIIDLVGFEGRLVQFIADYLNCTPEFYTLNQQEIIDTFNETGCVFEKLFANNNIKYSFGAFHSKSELNSTPPFSQSNFYFLSNIYLVVNNINHHKWLEIVIRPFQPQVWLTIGLVFMVGFVIIFATGYYNKAGSNAFVIGHERNTAPYYNMFVTFLGGLCSYPLPRHNFARYILGVWLLSTLVLRSAYQSGLYEMLRDHRDDEPPQSLAEVARQNYIIEMIPENAEVLKSLPEVKHVRFLNTNELQAFPVLAETTEHTAILTPYEYFGYFRKINQSMSRHLSLVQERIMVVPLSFYLPRNSFLLHILNQQILWAHNYGYISKWERTYMVDRKEKELGNGRATGVVSEDSTGKQLEVLSINELGSIFLLHLYLLLFACVVFVAELVTVKLKALRQKKLFFKLK